MWQIPGILKLKQLLSRERPPPQGTLVLAAGGLFLADTTAAVVYVFTRCVAKCGACFTMPTRRLYIYN